MNLWWILCWYADEDVIKINDIVNNARDIILITPEGLQWQRLNSEDDNDFISQSGHILRDAKCTQGFNEVTSPVAPNTSISEVNFPISSSFKIF